MPEASVSERAAVAGPSDSRPVHLGLAAALLLARQVNLGSPIPSGLSFPVCPLTLKVVGRF